MLKEFAEGKADIMYSFNHDYEWAEKNNAWLTNPYAEFYNMRISRKSQGNATGVALIPGTYFDYYIRKNFNEPVIECESYKAGLDLVEKDKAKYIYSTSPIGNYYSTFPEYQNLLFLSAYNFKSSYCIAVPRYSEETLVHLINKSIICIPDSLLLESFETQVHSRPILYSDLYYQYPAQTILFIIACLIVLGAAIFLIVYSKLISKKNIQLKMANNAKSDFLGRMSHDMRTPMNVILGLLHISKKTNDVNEIKKNLCQMEISSNLLLRLINDTLSMEKIESGTFKLNIVSTNVEELLNNVITNAKVLANAKGVELNLHFSENTDWNRKYLFTDGPRLVQISLNIISNAIKFTNKGAQLI